MSDLGNKLLYALSAYTSTSWQTFKKYFDELYGQYRPAELRHVPAQKTRTRALRLLQYLAHVDVTQDFSRIYCAPAVLARLPFSGVPQYALCGRRNPGTLDQLRAGQRRYRDRVSVHVTPDAHNGLAPDRIIVSTDGTDTAERYANETHVQLLQDPPTWLLLEACPSIGEYANSLRWIEGPELTWHVSDFDPDGARFERRLDSTEKIRLARYHDGGFRTIFQLRRGTQYTSATPEWAQHIIFGLHGIRPIQYDFGTSTVFMRAGVQLPAMLARALCLCSAAPPTSLAPNSGRTVSYARVPPQIAASVIQKLTYTQNVF